MSSGTILIVEDEAITALDIKQSLTGMGYDVCGVVSTGELAITRAGEYRPDLVLMDIKLAGEMNGIEAAAQIRERYGTAIIFLTAHVEDSTIEAAASTNPFGYLIKPIDEKTLKVTIQMALHRRALESEPPGEQEATSGDRNLIFLKKACNGVTLLLYTKDVKKSGIFHNFITESTTGQVQCIYAYFHTKLISHFRRFIKAGKIEPVELRRGTDPFMRRLRELCQSDTISGADGKLLCIVDFSDIGKFNELLMIKSEMVRVNTMPWDSFLAILAVPMEPLDASMLEAASAGVTQLVVLSGEDNIITFSTPVMQTEQVNAVPQEIFETVVKKSLEFVILSCLNRPVSGFAIIHEIKERFHVEVPIARVYSYLYEMEEKGLLSAEEIGRTKMYSPTPEGQNYINDRLRGLTAAYRQVLGIKS